MHSCNPRALEGEVEESEVQGQPWLCCKLEARINYMRPYFNNREGRGGAEGREREGQHIIGQLNSLHGPVLKTVSLSAGVSRLMAPKDNNALVL